MSLNYAGLQPWVKYLEKCTGIVVDSWESFANLSSLGIIANNAGLMGKIKQVYGDVRDIDLWVGGLLEKPQARPDQITGRTFTCIIGAQFRDLKVGDRFYYENAPDRDKGTLNSAFTLGNCFFCSLITFASAKGNLIFLGANFL